MIIGWENKYDDATISASDSVISLPVANTQVNPVKRPWRVSSSTAFVDIDFGSSISFRVFSLMAASQGNDLTSAATIRIRCSDASAAAGDILDTSTISAGVIDNYPHVYHIAASAVTAQFCRIDITDATLSTIDIGRIFVGPVWEPTISHSFGRGVSWADNADLVESEGGQLIVGAKPRFRLADFFLEFNSEAEMMANAFELDRSQGINDDILVMLNPDNFPQKLSLWGPLVRVTPLVIARHNQVQKRYQVRERL